MNRDHNGWIYLGDTFCYDPIWLRPEKEVHGYKAFNKDWKCLNKQYTCPGEFETTNGVILCHHGMHFCERIEDVFMYYSPYLQETKVAEVIAHGVIATGENKSCTDKLTIIRQLDIPEILSLVKSPVLLWTLAWANDLDILYNDDGKKVAYKDIYTREIIRLPY